MKSQKKGRGGNAMKTILAAVDFSDTTGQVAGHAVQVGAAFGAEVYLLHVEPPDPDFVGYEAGPQSVRDNVARAIGEDHQDMIELRDRLQGQGCKLHGLVIQGPTADKILSEAERLDCDLLVIGSHGHRPLLDVLLGSTSEAVLRRASRPVLVIPSK